MVTYLEGSQVSQPGVSVADWARKIGVLQGKLCCALADFEHPGASEFMPWNAMSPQLFDDQFLAGLGADLSALIAPHLERLEQDSFPRLQNMPTQVIHNDMHAGNILLNDAGSISGVIDFGDAIRGPVVQELAVSCTSLVEALSHAAFVPVQELIAGFCQEYPLDSEALNLLHDAMIMRSILSVGLGRAKDETVPLEERPRPATKASEAGLRTLLEMRLALSEATMDLRHLQ
jgi:Ser/Thr protein kinase RdoA (MazF antagonist)